MLAVLINQISTIMKNAKEISKQLNEMQTIQDNTKKGIFGVEVITTTIPTMNKKGNSYFGRVTKTTIYRNAVLGVSYEEAVNNRVEKVSGERNFVAAAPSGKKWYNPFFYVSLKDENVFYLRIGMRKNTTTESTYFVDGNIATPEQVEEIKGWLTNKSFTSQKQAGFGLTDENQYHFVSPLFDNVRRISVGAKVIFERTTLQTAAA